MPDPISSTSRPSYEACDPSIASCADPPPPTPAAATSAPTVTIAPVVITGDAGAQELLRRYDNQACSAQTLSAKLSCPAIGLGDRIRLRVLLAPGRQRGVSTRCSRETRKVIVVVIVGAAFGERFRGPACGRVS